MTGNLHLQYRGRLQKPHLVDSLQAEVEEICSIQAWPYQIWDESWANSQAPQKSLRGISFTTYPGAEMVWLTFQSDGVLQSLISRLNPTFVGNATDVPWQRMRIRLDEATIHLSVCRLLRYLSAQYFELFEVQDESGYWQHRDEAQLSQHLEAAAGELRLGQMMWTEATLGSAPLWGEA